MTGGDPADAQDLAWMARIKHGDTEAFRDLVEAHQSRVIGTVAKMLGNSAEAEDIAQQVFLRIWKSAPRYEPTAKFTTWLFKITRNLVFNEHRRSNRRPVTALEVEQEEHHLQPTDPAARGPGETLLDTELADAIQTAIDALPEPQRMAIILRRYEELPYEEIGAILDLTVPAVKSVLFRARQELRVRLEKYLRA